MITQARSIYLNQNQTYVIINLIQKLFLVVLMVVKLRASPFVLIDPSTGRAVEQVGQITQICEKKCIVLAPIYCSFCQCLMKFCQSLCAATPLLALEQPSCGARGGAN